jgi:ABC-type transport system substrate-binding protein
MRKHVSFILLGMTAFLLVPALVGIVHAAPKDTLVFVMSTEPVSLDPPNSTDALSLLLNRHIYDSPLQATESGDVVAGLFTRWEHSPDGLTWTFYLRKGVKFHDGTALDAGVIKENWDRCMSDMKRVQRRSFFTPWAQNIKVIDAFTIQTKSSKPFAPIISFLAHGSGGMISPAALTKYGDRINRNPVGTGPFRFVEWVPGNRLVLDRNDDYWGPKPKIKRIDFRFVKESGARLMMLETGEADLVMKVSPADIERLKKNPALDLRVEPYNRVMGFYVNTTAPLLSDIRFRQALAYAIDREAIVKHVMKGVAHPCCSVIGGTTYGTAEVPCYEYNLEKAKQLLKESGYKGEPLTLETTKGRSTMDLETSVAVQNYWQKVGINVKLGVQEFATLQNMLDSGKYQVALLGASPSTGDGDQVLRSRYHSEFIPPKGATNYSRYANPDYDKVSEAQLSELNKAKRLALMKRAQEMLARDLPFIPLYRLDEVLAVRKNLKGVQTMTTMEVTDVREAYFE